MHTRRRLPPFVAVRAFEAAARHLSFTTASQELHVTQSAISHQVKRLEEFLDVALFLRHAHGIELTGAGRAYLSELTDVLDRLDSSTRRLCSPGKPEALRIRATPAFASRWLVPRMHRFYAEHPDIEWHVSTGLSPTSFSKGDVDIVICWGDEPVAGACVEPFLVSPRAPVASHLFLRHAPDLSEPRDLLNVTLIHDEVQDGWNAWFKACGVDPPDAPRGPRFAHCELTLSAAERGQGVALAYIALVEGDLASGRLIRLFDHQTPPILIYSLAYLSKHEQSRKIRAFRRWIFNETGGPATSPLLTLDSAEQAGRARVPGQPAGAG